MSYPQTMKFHCLVFCGLVAGYASPALALDCTGAEEAVRASQRALEDCTRVGIGPCTDEEQAVADAQSALDRCKGGEPTTPPKLFRPAFDGTVAVLVEASSDEDAVAIRAGALVALTGIDVIEGGAVRAAQAFLGASPTPEAVETLLSAVKADELLVIAVKPEKDLRFLSFKIVGRRAQTRFAEATTSTLGEVVKSTVSEFYPLIEVVPVPTPRPFVWATPTPTPAPGPPPPPWIVHASLFAGRKSLRANDWAPLAQQNEAGLLTNIGQTSWPVLAACDVTYSSSKGSVENVQLRSTTLEAAFGGRRSFQLPLVQPEVGGGFVFTRVNNSAEFPDKTETVSATGFGYWISGGGSVRIRSLTAGLHLRFSSANATLGKRSLDTGGFHLGVAAGVNFGTDAR